VIRSAVICRASIRKHAAICPKCCHLIDDADGNPTQLLSGSEDNVLFVSRLFISSNDRPPIRPIPAQVTPKELVFVLDTSGSMSGFPIEKANKALADSMEALFVHDGQAELELTLVERTKGVLRRLAAAGFVVQGLSTDAHKVFGRIAVQKVELLLEQKAVQYIAIHRRRISM
jgi:hypothetical protein